MDNTKNLSDLVVVQYQGSAKRYVFKLFKGQEVKDNDWVVVNTLDKYEVVRVIKVIKQDLDNVEYLKNALKATKFIVDVVDTFKYDGQLLAEQTRKLRKRLLDVGGDDDNVDA